MHYLTNYSRFCIQKHQRLHLDRYSALYHTRSHVRAHFRAVRAICLSGYLLASVSVEPSSLVQDRTTASSDECVLTDLVDSVATVFPDRDGIATAQRTDAFFGPTLSALKHTSYVRTSIGNDYAISGDLLCKQPSGSTSNYYQVRLCVPNSMVNSLFKHYHNSSLDGHCNGLRTCDRLRVLYTWFNMGQDIFKRCESCHSYNSTRPRHPDTRGIMSSTPPNRPFERVSVDLIK
jgi:hypothetical protein